MARWHTFACCGRYTQVGSKPNNDGVHATAEGSGEVGMDSVPEWGGGALTAPVTVAATVAAAAPTPAAAGGPSDSTSVASCPNGDPPPNSVNPTGDGAPDDGKPTGPMGGVTATADSAGDAGAAPSARDTDAGDGEAVPGLLEAAEATLARVAFECAVGVACGVAVGFALAFG